MKYVILLFVLFLSSAVFAQYTGPSGQGTVSVAKALDMGDDAPVILEGKIERHIEGEKYLFTDGKDSIVVEIDAKLWKNVTISDDDVVRIFGEVDTDWLGAAKIEVEGIERKTVR